ncbi:sensor histidine kinase [Acuticoccus sp. I52.16.1]|uniref:sensor histidine kinase n=1 Tax=Acuticoccus sp. I52.16.1 TaxID=2928472 RepID=UPI001FD39E44|nr:histidine kinase dimerization/phosphoacceptor domain -containing protein [Acuticoccus sp. I52.16.1]UOM36350.1 GAF domain-containing protein [Acuticoccus sp. I52.16.1]
MTAQTDVAAAGRRKALEQYEILDTPRESEFDEIAELAAAICEAPVALVSFVDTDRQWFKAEVGFGCRQTPLDQSICRYALGEADILEIPDTRLDPRSMHNALVVDGPKVRFYAGAVLRSSDGVALGTLCVLDVRPRTLTDLQRKTLRTLARQVVREMELRLSLRLQDVLRREIDHRVKNQLQSVASFVRLKAGRAPNEATRRALQEVSHRISAAALLHEELYSLDSGDEVALDRYMDKLGRFVAASAPEGVALVVEVDPVRVTPAQAASVAAIVNEFVTNAFKHAFPTGRAGRILVVGRVGQGELVVRMSDDGVGCDGPLASGGIGMRIMSAAAEKVAGTLAFDTAGPGVALTLAMPLVRPAIPARLGRSGG